MYSDNTQEPLTSAVEQSSDNATASVFAKPQKGRSKPVRKGHATRPSKPDSSTAKPRRALSLKPINDTSMLYTTSLTKDTVTPIEENVVEDDALMVGLHSDRLIF